MSERTNTPCTSLTSEPRLLYVFIGNNTHRITMDRVFINIVNLSNIFMSYDIKSKVYSYGKLFL